MDIDEQDNNTIRVSHGFSADSLNRLGCQKNGKTHAKYFSFKSVNSKELPKRHNLSNAKQVHIKFEDA